MNDKKPNPDIRNARAIADATRDAASVEDVIQLHLSLAQQTEDQLREEIARVAEHLREQEKAHNDAIQKRIYWESQLHAVQNKGSQITATPAKHYDSHGNLMEFGVNTSSGVAQPLKEKADDTLKVAQGALTKAKGVEEALGTVKVTKGSEDFTPITINAKLPKDMDAKEFRRRLVEAGNKILDSHEKMARYR